MHVKRWEWCLVLSSNEDEMCFEAYSKITLASGQEGNVLWITVPDIFASHPKAIEPDEWQRIARETRLKFINEWCQLFEISTEERLEEIEDEIKDLEFICKCFREGSIREGLNLIVYNPQAETTKIQVLGNTAEVNSKVHIFKVFAKSS